MTKESLRFCTKHGWYFHNHCPPCYEEEKMRNITVDYRGIDERAYRRGALQAIEFALREITSLPPDQILEWLGRYQQALVEGRSSLDMKYMGTYLDEVLKSVK